MLKLAQKKKLEKLEDNFREVSNMYEFKFSENVLY